MDLRFNTVLVPPAHIAKAAIEFAQRNFSHDHMGYCLSYDNHLPHITLAQSRLNDDSIVNILRDNLAGLDSYLTDSIKLKNYYHHIDRAYCGLSVNLTNQLHKLHNIVVSIHKELGAEIQGAYGDEYWPHMTFAKTSHQLRQPVDIQDNLQGESNGWILEFGHMGDHGVYLGKYNK